MIKKIGGKLAVLAEASTLAITATTEKISFDLVEVGILKSTYYTPVLTNRGQM